MGGVGGLSEARGCACVWWSAALPLIPPLHPPMLQVLHLESPHAPSPAAAATYHSFDAATLCTLCRLRYLTATGYRSFALGGLPPSLRHLNLGATRGAPFNMCAVALPPTCRRAGGGGAGCGGEWWWW